MSKRRHTRKNTAQRPALGPGGYGEGAGLTEGQGGSPVAHKHPRGFPDETRQVPIDTGQPAPLGQSRTAIAGPHLESWFQAADGPERVSRGLDRLRDTARTVPVSQEVPPAFRRESVPARAILGGRRTDGGEGLPGGLQPADIIAVEQPLGYVAAGIPVPPEIGQPPGAKVWRPAAGQPDDALGRLNRQVRALLDAGMSSDDIAGSLEQLRAMLDAGMSAEEIVAAVASREAVASLDVPAGSDDELLPPSLRGLPVDTAVPVIISTHEARPEGAGEFLGRLTRTMRTENGAVWPEGAAVWRNLAPPDPGAFDDQLVLSGDDTAPLVTTAAVAPGGPAAPVRTAWQAENVLDRHARLARRYADLDPHCLGYLAHLLNAAWEDDPEQAALVHWPVAADGERGIPEARQLARLVGRQLRDALTYQVTAPLVADMRRFSELLPGVQRLSEAILPALAGFAWLDDPWVIPVADGLLPVRAVSWERITVPADVFSRGTRFRPADAVRLVFWVHIPDVIASGHFEADDTRIAALERDLGDLLPHHVTILPFGLGYRLADTHKDTALAMIALVHSLWTYLGMELSASRTVRPAGKGHRRNVLRSIRHDKVHVITLRRISYISDSPAGHRQVNRTCKWWVDDFSRHIDPYTDEDENGRPRRHEAVPAGHARQDPDGDDHDICAICEARGQAVRITLVHGHRRGPAYLPWKTPAKGRTVHRLSR